MPRIIATIAAAAVVCLLSLPASPASARIVEIGRTDDAPAPSCPARPCYAISRTTGYQAKIGPNRGLYTVPQDGKLVAWTIRLGRPGTRQTEFFEQTYGGPAQAGITVIRPGKKLYGRVVTQSPIYQLKPYFGQTVQFPLGRAMNVKKGYLVALTVPTWAPALSVGLASDTSWRASRARDLCNDLKTQTSQMRLGSLTQYRCLYKTARLTYSATLVTSPQRQRQTTPAEDPEPDPQPTPTPTPTPRPR